MDLDRWRRAVASYHGGGGVRDWSLQVTETRRLAVQTKDRETGNAHTPVSLAEALGGHFLICWKDGLVSRGTLERRMLDGEPREILDAARAAGYSDPDAAVVAGPASFPDVALHDRTVAEAAAGETETVVERWGRVRDRVRDARCRTWSGSLHVSETRTRVTTSPGLDVSSLATLQSWHVTIDGETGGGLSARAFEPRAEHAARLDRVLETAALLREAAPSFSGGLVPVVIHPDVVENLVLATLLHHLEAATVAHGEGRFRREQFGSGRPVIREDLNLRLDPLRPLGAGSYRFTREGLPAAGCTYIEDGALVTPVADFKYARRLGIPPTPLPYGHEALFLEGPRPLTTPQAFAEAEGGALVLNVLGIHTLDAASGDFSLSAPQVLTIGPFGPRGRIRATLSGNLFDLLQSEALRLVAFEGEHVPGLLVSCRLDPRP